MALGRVQGGDGRTTGQGAEEARTGQGGEARVFLNGIEVAHDDQGNPARRRQPGQQVGDLARANRGGVFLPGQMGVDHVDGAAVERYAQAEGGAVVVQRLQLLRFLRDHRQAAEQGVAVAAGRTLRVSAGEGDGIAAERIGEGLRLVGQADGGVLEHLLQGDDVRVVRPDGGDEQRQTRGPVALVMPDIEGDEAEVAAPRRRPGGAGDQRQGGQTAENAAAKGHGEGSGFQRH